MDLEEGTLRLCLLASTGTDARDLGRNRGSGCGCSTSLSLSVPERKIGRIDARRVVRFTREGNLVSGKTSADAHTDPPDRPRQSRPSGLTPTESGPTGPMHAGPPDSLGNLVRKGHPTHATPSEAFAPPSIPPDLTFLSHPRNRHPSLPVCRSGSRGVRVARCVRVCEALCVGAARRAVRGLVARGRCRTRGGATARPAPPLAGGSVGTTPPRLPAPERHRAGRPRPGASGPAAWRATATDCRDDSSARPTTSNHPRRRPTASSRSERDASPADPCVSPPCLGLPASVSPRRPPDRRC